MRGRHNLKNEGKTADFGGFLRNTSSLLIVLLVLQCSVGSVQSRGFGFESDSCVLGQLRHFILTALSTAVA